MEQQDVMCLGLSISRSMATIADPSKLIIKEVYPVYMSLEAFLDSSIFNMQVKGIDATGGFDKGAEAELAIGAGNQSVSGLMPLYLFEEHWNLARRKC